MKRVLTVLSTALFLMIIVSCNSEDKKLEQVDLEISQIMEKMGAVGLSAAVVKDNEIIFEKAYGLKNVETEEPLQTNSLFRIASISKSFSCTAIGQLVEQGKLTLDDDISDLVGFKIRNPKFPDDVITVRTLLQHRSSLNDNEGYFTLDVINPATNPDCANCYNDYAPGCGYEYCNLNYNLIGTVIEKLSGERFDKYIKHHILDPLHLYGGYCVDSLDNALFATIYESDKNLQLQPQPEAYAPRREILANYQMGYSTPVFSPTGGMKISAPDLARYMIMHMNYGQGLVDGEWVRIMPEEHSHLMQTKYSEEEGYGMALRVMDNEWVPEYAICHTGGAYGLSSVMYFSPVRKWGIVVINNGTRIPEDEDNDERHILTDPVRCLYRHFIAE